MEKPERKLKDGFYWEVNHAWIKTQIVKLSGTLTEDDLERDLIETKIKDNYTHEQTIFFSLNGSPSRGFAIYAGRKLCIINKRFDKKKVFKDTLIKGNEVEEGM